jgi:hypothetical protein
MRNTMILPVLAAILAGGLALGGELLSPESLLPVHENQDAYLPAAAFGKDSFLVVWQSGRIGAGSLVPGQGEPAGAGDIVGCRVDKSGKALDAKPFVVSAAADFQERPRVAFGKTVFLVVWQDLRNGKDYDVYAARVSPDGKTLDPDGILVAGGEHNQCCPAVAFDGTGFLVVWQDFRTGKYTIGGSRVSIDGKPLDSARGPEGAKRVEGVLDAGGIVLGNSGRGEFHRITPAASSLGDGRAIVFWVAKSTRAGQGELSGGCFVSDGKIEKQFQFKATGYGAHYAAPSDPQALAGGPKGFLVAWRNAAAVGRGTPSRNANAAFFSPEGEKEPSDEKATKGAFNLNGAAGWHHIADPAVAWDGSGFVAAWSEQRGMPDHVRRTGLSPFDAVFATRLSAEGKPSGQELAVAGSFEAPACGAAAASDGAGTTLVAYEQHPEKGDVPIKIGVRMLTTK